MKNKSGFTLVEMMVTVAIISIIAATAAPAVYKYTQARGVKNAADSLFMKMHKYQRLCKKRRIRADISFNTPAANQYTIVLTDPVTGPIGNPQTFNLADYPGGVQFDAGTVGQIRFGINGLCESPFSGAAILTNAGNTRRFRVRTTLAGGISIHRWYMSDTRWVSN